MENPMKTRSECVCSSCLSHNQNPLREEEAVSAHARWVENLLAEGLAWTEMVQSARAWEARSWSPWMRYGKARTLTAMWAVRMGTR